MVPAQAGEIGGTVDLGRRGPGSLGARPGSRAGTFAPTQRGGAGPTVVGGGTVPGQTMRPGTTRLGGAAAPTVLRQPRPGPAPPPSGGHPVLYVVLGGMFVLLLGAGGYIYITKMQPPPTTLASLSPTTEAPAPTTLATPTPAPPTTVPPPTFGEAKGKGATAMKAAQAAFGRNDYDRALTSVQEALRDDPGNLEAKRLAENALNGQRANARLRAAEAALRQGDFATADRRGRSREQVGPLGWPGHEHDRAHPRRPAPARAGEGDHGPGPKAATADGPGQYATSIRPPPPWAADSTTWPSSSTTTR